MALEGFIRNCVDRDIRLLIQFDVDDVGFVHFYLSRDQGHVRNRHDSAARGALDSLNHRLPYPHR